MLPEKQAEEAIVDAGATAAAEEEEEEEQGIFSVKSMLWHGGSAWDAWFSCASNQVAQVLLTLPYSFSQLGMLSGVVFQIFYGLMGSWTAYLISVLIWSFLGLGMTTFTAWYLTIAAIVHGQVKDVQHSGPKKMVLYFTGATNILYTFGGHAVTVEIMHAMWKPRKFKYIYLLATLYVFTLTLPSASAMYWAYGDQLLTHANAFSLLPRTGWRDTAVVLMLIHQFITFGFACTPLYFVWEKVIGMHDTKSMCLRALARLPVVIPIWFLAIIFPFFGPINSAVGALLVSFTVYIIPSLAHMLTYRKASARRNAAEKPPFFMPSWTAMYAVNAFVVVWVLVIGFGFGGWASVTNFVKQVDSFGLFARCYQCKPPPQAHPAAPTH
ncbi:Auxin transporter protein 1 [Striga hermonthica]|uniref:Auxin transporter protein 1 n=1 Tax=Striga hermonthica TaxID=68872 RepID=A0A9N7NIA4_STRHE|nr:Auxin transporter protein 1 [Striga hermonthica]